MSKRNSDGDVLANRLSLGLAKNQKLLASWMGSEPHAQPADDASKTEDEDVDLKQILYGHDRLGVGGVLPKDVADGTFTRRTITSSDKLLEQLIGKKKAKAHIAAKQHAERLGTQPQPKQGRQAVKKEESEDEEEGRAATFKSKRRRALNPRPDRVSEKEDVVEDDAANPGVADAAAEESEEQEKTQALQKCDDDSDQAPAAAKQKSMPSRGRAKPTSYLDELLAERSKKKKNKTKNKNATET